jgi:hypothetical protein
MQDGRSKSRVDMYFASASILHKTAVSSKVQAFIFAHPHIHTSTLLAIGELSGCPLNPDLFGHAPAGT